jgi:phage terminase Nu1 subunit (DNA packaging protein)
MPDAGNPFMGGGTQTGAMVPYNPSANQPVQAGGYRARVGNADVMFASEADFLKADKAWREQMQDQGAPIVGGGGGAAVRNWELASHRGRSRRAVGAFLQGRNIRRKLDELRTRSVTRRPLADDLAALANNTKYAELIPVLLKAFEAERNATEASITLLEDQLTAIDIQTGAGVAKVAGELWDGSGGAFSGRGETGVGTLVGVGAAGLGLGLLFANSRDDRRSRRR